MDKSKQDKIKEVANVVARRFPFVKKVLRPFYYAIKQRWKKERNRIFQESALSVLIDFHNCMEKYGYSYTLAFGSMLGAVREKGFIKHDCDIDTQMWIDEWKPEMEVHLNEAGFVLDHKFLIEEGKLGREETYTKNGVAIDIFYIYPAINDYPYCCDFLGRKDAPTYRMCNQKYGGAIPRRLEMPFEKERILVPFENTELYIPKNAHILLKFRYGESYMTPNPEWTISSYNNHIIEWDDKRGVYYGK